MTRILYWNIENFSHNKIFDESTDRDYDKSQERSAHIVNTVMGANLPDIFVIVEIYGRTRDVSNEGVVVNSDGNVGFTVLLLLEEIRSRHGRRWCLVPPINLGAFGFREATAVFYNSANLQFAGPYIWCNRRQQIGANQSQPLNGGNFAAITNYSNNWLEGLPHPNNPIPELRLNRTFNVGGYVTPEYQFAGQWEYYNPAPPYNRLFFPSDYNRSPFLTQFVDLTPGAGNRIIKIFSIHTSPSTAGQAVEQLANVREIQNVLPGEVSVVVGDFNVDSFSDFERYNGIGRLGYTMHLSPLSPVDGLNYDDRKRYCLTHLLPVPQACPFNTIGVVPDPQHNFYPRFGYMGSYINPHLSDTGCIDNVFTRYGGGVAVAPPASNISIINTVVGKPYNVMPAPAGVTAELTGGYAYPSTLAPADRIPLPGGINPALGVGNFRNWNNFELIHSTSDHLALIIDV